MRKWKGSLVEMNHRWFIALDTGAYSVQTQCPVVSLLLAHTFLNCFCGLKVSFTKRKTPWIKTPEMKNHNLPFFSSSCFHGKYSQGSRWIVHCNTAVATWWNWKQGWVARLYVGLKKIHSREKPMEGYQLNLTKAELKESECWTCIHSSGGLSNRGKLKRDVSNYFCCWVICKVVHVSMSNMWWVK